MAQLKTEVCIEMECLQLFIQHQGQNGIHNNIYKLGSVWIRNNAFGMKILTQRIIMFFLFSLNLIMKQINIILLIVFLIHTPICKDSF